MGVALVFIRKIQNFLTTILLLTLCFPAPIFAEESINSAVLRTVNTMNTWKTSGDLLNYLESKTSTQNFSWLKDQVKGLYLKSLPRVKVGNLPSQFEIVGEDIVVELVSLKQKTLMINGKKYFFDPGVPFERHATAIGALLNQSAFYLFGESARAELSTGTALFVIVVGIAVVWTIYEYATSNSVTVTDLYWLQKAVLECQKNCDQIKTDYIRACEKMLKESNFYNSLIGDNNTNTNLILGVLNTKESRCNRELEKTKIPELSNNKKIMGIPDNKDVKFRIFPGTK